MAKKSKDTIYQEFLAELKAINPKIEEVLTDDKVVTKLREGVLARADYSQSKDELDAQKAQFEQEVQEARTRIAGWQKWYGEESQKSATLVDKLNRYIDEYGELDNAGQRREAAKHGMTKEEFDAALNAELEKRSTAMIKFADDLTDLKMDYSKRFGERLNTEELYKIAGEKNLPLTAAYDQYVAPRVEAQKKVEFEEAIKKAKEEGAAEALSRHNLPNVSSQSSLGHVLDSKDAKTDSSARVADAVASFMKQNK